MKYPIFTFVILLGYASQSRAQESEEYPWLDDMHSSIANSMNASAQWFDDFFVSEQNEADPKALGEARIRLGWEPRSRDLAEFDTRFRVRFKLPKLKNRVDVVVSDYDDTAPESADRAARPPNGGREERFSLALQWQAKPNSGLSHRIGVGRRLQAFAKSRYRDTIDLTQESEIRWESSLYYYSSDGFGANFSALLNWQLGQQSLFRFDNNFYYRDNTKDWLWQHSWQYLHQLNDKSALVYGYYIEGLNQPNYQLNEHLTSIRFRKNALREWLFYEIEPFILWRRDEDFEPSYGIALRIEGYFDKD